MATEKGPQTEADKGHETSLILDNIGRLKGMVPKIDRLAMEKNPETVKATREIIAALSDSLDRLE